MALVRSVRPGVVAWGLARARGWAGAGWAYGNGNGRWIHGQHGSNLTALARPDFDRAFIEQ